MAESEEDFGVQDNAITWRVIDGELTSSTPSMLLGTAMVTTDIGVSTVMVTNDLDMSTEQPYEEFAEVKAALLIDRHLSENRPSESSPLSKWQAWLAILDL
ncbi:hypothetical protein ACOMHN_037979 [Nucella lapillus]